MSGSFFSSSNGSIEQPATFWSLAGRSVFITGGGSGIGESLVEHFALQGAKVCFVDIAEEASLAVIERLRGQVSYLPFFIPCDLTNIEELRAAISRATEVYGPIKVLVNNAGNDDRHSTESVTVDYWDNRMQVNLRHQFFAAQAVRSQMRAAGGGSIINFGSITWLPGWVMTDRQVSLWLNENGEKQIKDRQCLSEKIYAADIARMVLFLAADDSRMCTSQNYIVDGGWV